MATLKQIAADARTLAGELNFTDPTDQEVLRFAEESLQQIGKLLQGVDPRVYGHVSVHKFGSVDGVLSITGATWTAATKTIGKNATFSNVSPGSVIVAYGESGAVKVNGVGVVVSATANSVVLDRDLFGGLIATDPLPFEFIIILADSTNPHTITLGQQVSDIVMVTGTLCGNMRGLTVDEYLGVTSNPNYDSSGVFYQRGQTLEVRAGSSLSNGLGIVTVYYYRRPATLSAMTDTVDLPIRYHQVLRDEIAKKLMVRRSKIVPPELSDPLMALKAQSELNAGTKMKKDAKRDIANQ